MPPLEKIFQLSFLLSKINLCFASPSHRSQPQEAKRRWQNLAKLRARLLPESCLSELQILIISLFYVLCIDLIRAPTLQWGSVTGGVLSPEKNWCSLTKEKWISKLILSWEPRIPIHVNSALSFYSLTGASQNYLRWIKSPKTRLITRPRPPELNPRSAT